MRWKEQLEPILRWGLPLMVFLLPWQTHYIFADYSVAFPYYGDASLYGFDLAFLVLLLVWCAWFFTDHRWERFKHHSRLVTGVFEVLLGFGALSLLWSPNQLVSFLVWLRLLQASILILMLVTAPIRRREMAIAFASAGALQGVIAIAQFFTQDIAAHKWLGIAAQSGARLGASVVEQGELRWLRAYGTLPHPNVLGGWLVIALLCAGSLYIDEYRRLAHGFDRARLWRVAAFLAAYVFCAVGLMLTFSRSAWLGAAVGCGLFVVTTFAAAKKDEQKFVAVAAGKLIVATAAIVLLLNLTFTNLWWSRAQGQGRLAEQSTRERQVLMDQANTVISQQGYKGVGIGAYEAEIMRQNPGQPVYTYQPVHNVWLLLYAELGFAGFGLLILWMGCWYVFVKALFSGKIARAQALPYALILTIGLMAYFDHFWWTLPTGLLAASAPVALALKQRKNPAGHLAKV